MTLQDILSDIHALTEDLKVYERKYGILSETFYPVYTGGAEPEDSAWMLDWSDWAGTYKIGLARTRFCCVVKNNIAAPLQRYSNKRNR